MEAIVNAKAGRSESEFNEEETNEEVAWREVARRGGAHGISALHSRGA
jgi:hypothetical protein